MRGDGAGEPARERGSGDVRWLPAQPRTSRLLRALRRAPAPADAPPDLLGRLAKAERLIDLGWGVAVVWAALRMVGVLWITRGSGEFDAAWLIDPLLILLLAYGLYRRSRVCAGLLLAYVVVELWLAYHVAGRPAGIGVALALELAFLTGLRGTVLWHREQARR